LICHRPETYSRFGPTRIEKSPFQLTSNAASSEIIRDVASPGVLIPQMANVGPPFQGSISWRFFPGALPRVITGCPVGARTNSPALKVRPVSARRIAPGLPRPIPGSIAALPFTVDRVRRVTKDCVRRPDDRSNANVRPPYLLPGEKVRMRASFPRRRR
jgi:hypothetical protein